jgi:hypothetical protein
VSRWKTGHACVWCPLQCLRRRHCRMTSLMDTTDPEKMLSRQRQRTQMPHQPCGSMKWRHHHRASSPRSCRPQASQVSLVAQTPFTSHVSSRTVPSGLTANVYEAVRRAAAAAASAAIPQRTEAPNGQKDGPSSAALAPVAAVVAVSPETQSVASDSDCEMSKAHRPQAHRPQAHRPQAHRPQATANATHKCVWQGARTLSAVSGRRTKREQRRWQAATASSTRRLRLCDTYAHTTVTSRTHVRSGALADLL